MTPFGVLKHELFVVMVMFQVVVAFFVFFVVAVVARIRFGRPVIQVRLDSRRFFLGDIRGVIL